MKPWRLRLGAVIVAVALGLTGCASGPGGSSPSAPGSSQPVRAEALFASIDSLGPITATPPGSMLLTLNIYDSLATMTKKGATLPLVRSIELGTTADGQAATLRGGPTYSDSTIATGRDVLDSFSHSAQSPSYATLYSDIDFEASSASGSTAMLKLKGPASDLLESSLGMFSAIVPKGKFTSIGAGPFAIDKGGPGTDYQLRANDKYWDSTPPIPQVAMVPIPDSTAQANALRAGEIDLTTSLSSTALTILSGAPNVKVADATLESTSALELALSTRVTSFNDPEVRRAAKLIMDQGRLVNTILGSIGEVANNILGKGYGNYPEDVAQTAANKEEARYIFTERGVTSFTIVAADAMPGMASSAELMAQELTEVEMQVTVDKRDPQTYYNSLEELHQAQAATAFWTNHNPITEFRSQVMPGYPFSLSGFTSEAIQQNPAEATATLGAAERKRPVGEIDKEIHDQNGDLARGCQKRVSAYRAGLENFISVQSVPRLTKATSNPIG